MDNQLSVISSLRVILRGYCSQGDNMNKLISHVTSKFDIFSVDMSGTTSFTMRVKKSNIRKGRDIWGYYNQNVSEAVHEFICNNYNDIYMNYCNSPGWKNYQDVISCIVNKNNTIQLFNVVLLSENIVIIMV